jgi:hypothetical protein
VLRGKRSARGLHYRAAVGSSFQEVAIAVWYLHAAQSFRAAADPHPVP